MRQLTAFFLLIMFLVGGINCIYSLENRQLHQEELELAMESAMRHSLTAAKIKKSYSISSEEELYSDFLGELMLTLGADAEYEITVYELDLEKGIMDIQVVSTFSLPGGTKAQAECRKYAVVVQV